MQRCCLKKRIPILWLLLVAGTAGLLAADEFPGSISSWNGFDQFDFELDKVACRVVRPDQVAEGRPWIWRARFWGHEPQTDIALLEKGFHLVYCDVANLWGNAEAIHRWNSFYAYLTGEHGFSRRPVLEGMSRGGLIVYHWAIEHPRQVSCIYADAPALGLRPYVRDLDENHPELDQIRAWMKAHDLTLAGAQRFKGDALDRMAPLARAGVPLIHVCGDADQSVPFEEHTEEFARRYRKLGGTIEVIVKKGGAHHPHSLTDPAPIVRFILEAQTRVEPEVSHGPFIGHVTDNSALIWARCPRPGRYLLKVTGRRDRQQYTAVSMAESDGCMVWKLEGLRPSRRYDYQLESQGKPLLVGGEFFFHTAAARDTGPVRLAFASCAKEDEGSSAVWRRIASLDPQAVVLLGDTPYIDSTDLAVQRQRYGEFAAVADFRQLARTRSLYSTWDDHDFGRNDTDGNVPGKDNSRRAFIEYRANPSYGDGTVGIYTSFRRGPVEVFLLDTRYFAATEPSPFDPQRPSLLGKSQWEWLLRKLKNSTAPFKILACGMIWNEAVRPGKLDHWGTYPHERQALFDFIGRENIPGVLLVGGDIHRTRLLEHHAENSAGYRIPELITSPVHASVIETANMPHPALIHDAGEPNTFLLVDVEGQGPGAQLVARFLDKQGETVHQVRYVRKQLQGPTR
jgi:alkaline phosphatase D